MSLVMGSAPTFMLSPPKEEKLKHISHKSIPIAISDNISFCERISDLGSSNNDIRKIDDEQV